MVRGVGFEPTTTPSVVVTFSHRPDRAKTGKGIKCSNQLSYPRENERANVLRMVSTVNHLHPARKYRAGKSCKAIARIERAPFRVCAIDNALHPARDFLQAPGFCMKENRPMKGLPTFDRERHCESISFMLWPTITEFAFLSSTIYSSAEVDRHARILPDLRTCSVDSIAFDTRQARDDVS